MSNTGYFCITVGRGGGAIQLLGLLTANVDVHPELKNLDCRIVWPGLIGEESPYVAFEPRQQGAAVLVGNCDSLTPKNAKDMLGSNWQGMISKHRIQAFYVVDSTYGDDWEEVLCR